MSYPPSLTTTRLTADFRRLSGGAALEAEVWIASPSALVSAEDDVIIPRANLAVGTSSGLLDVELPVADAAGWGPQGFQYLIRATFDTGVQMAWLVQLLTGQGETQDLADYGVEVPYPNSSAAFVVTYPSAPAGGGGGGTAGVTSFKGRSGVVVPATDDYTMPQITGLVAALIAKADLVGGVLPTSQLPPLAVTSYLGSSANQSAMLAKSGQEGDWTIRTDLGTMWWITGDPTTLGGWTQAAYPTAPVFSVNTQTGAVVLSAADVGAPPTTRTITAGVALTGGGDLSANRTMNVSLGTSSNQAAAGNDPRFTDSRTPLAHAATHASAGGDAITIAQSQVTGLVAALAAAAPQKDPNAAVYGLKLAILDPFETQSTALNLNNGALLLMRKWVPENMTLTKLGTWMRTAGVTNIGFSGIALYDAAGNLIDKTGDMSAQFATANAYVEGTIASTVSLTANTAVYFAVLAQFSGTNPQISGRPSSSLIAINGLRSSVFVNGTTAFPASVDINAASLNDAAYYLTAR